MDADTDIIKSNTSRKRPYNSVSSSSISPSSTVKSEMITKSNTNQSTNNNNTIDEYKVWQEIKSFIPLLTYGEESIELLNSLLCLPFGIAAEGSVEDSVGNTSSLDCNKRKLSAKDAYKQKEASLSNLARVLNNMLHVRGVMRRRGSSCMQQQQQVAAATKSPHSKKKQRMVKEEKPSQSPAKSTTAAVANKKEVDILPWNVLLRITIRITAHVVKQLNSYDTSAASSNKQKDDEQVGERGEASVHPLLQVLDIVSGSLHLLTRMQKQKQSQLNETTTASGKNTKITTPTKKKRASAQPPSSQSTNNKAQLPKDRMIYDWKSNNNKLKSRSRLSPTGREIWGPSRYTFLKDIDSITQLLKVDKDAVSIMGINHDDWYERINSIVQALDECVRVEQRLQFGNDVSPIRHEDGVGEQLQQSATLGISPSLLRKLDKE